VPKSLEENVLQPPLHLRDGLCHIHKRLTVKGVMGTSTFRLLCFEWLSMQPDFLLVDGSTPFRMNQSGDSQITNFTGFPLQSGWGQTMTDCKVLSSLTPGAFPEAVGT